MDIWLLPVDEKMRISSQGPHLKHSLIRGCPTLHLCQYIPRKGQFDNARNLKVFCRLASSNLLSSNNTNSKYSVMSHQGQYWRNSKSGKHNAIGIGFLLTGCVWSNLTWTGLNTFYFKCGYSVPGLMLAVNLTAWNLA